MWLEIIKVIATIIVASIAAFGGGFLTYKKFIIERQDAKDKELLQKQIDDSVEKAMETFIEKCGSIGDKAIEKAKEEVRSEFQEGLKMRGDEGAERFATHNKAINENSAMIKEILTVQKDQTEKFDKMADAITALAQVSEACAESQRNSNYDRLLIVANKIIKSRKMTMTEKTNLIQLYKSWEKLNGKDDKLTVMYDECMKITPVLDEGA